MKDSETPKLDVSGCPIRARLLSVSTSIERPISGPSLSHSELPKSLTVLFEIRGRVVEDFVLLQKGVNLHPRLETKEPPNLCSGEGTLPICLKRQAFDRRTRQILPFRFKPLSDVLRQLCRNLHGWPSLLSIVSGATFYGHSDRRIQHWLMRKGSVCSGTWL